jgi:hypothetical protein
MVKTALRTFVATLAGLLGSFILIVMIEAFGGKVHPFPSDFNGTQEEICRHVERYPAWVLAVVVLMWTATAFVGVWIARRIGGLYAATIVGFLLLAGLICNLSMLPYPMWFKIACLVAIPASIIRGVAKSRRQAEA